MTTPTVLIVDDEPLLRRLLRGALFNAGYRVLEAENGKEALERCKLKVDVILLDIGLPDADGIALMLELRKSKFTGPMVIMTSHGTQENRDRAHRLGARHFLVKPFGEQEVLPLIKGLIPLEENAHPAEDGMAGSRRTVPRAGAGA